MRETYDYLFYNSCFLSSFLNEKEYEFLEEEEDDYTSNTYVNYSESEDCFIDDIGIYLEDL